MPKKAPTPLVSLQVAQRALNSFGHTVQKAPFLPPPDECECNQSLQILAKYLEDVNRLRANEDKKFSLLRFHRNRTEYKEEEEKFCFSIVRSLVYAYKQLKSSPRLVGLVSKVLQTSGLALFVLEPERRNCVMTVFQHAASLSTKRQWKTLLSTLCETAVSVTGIVGDWIATEILRAAFEVTASSNWALREHLYIAALVEGTLNALKQNSLKVSFLEQLVSDTRTSLERRSDMQSRSLGFMILAGVIRAWNPEDAFNDSYRTVHNLFKQEIERATQDSIYSANITCEQDFGIILYTVTVSCGIAASCKRIDSLSSTIFILAHCLDYLSAPFLRRQKFFQPLDEDSWNILCYHSTSFGYAAAELLIRNPKQHITSFFHNKLLNTCQEVFNSCKSWPVSQDSLVEYARMAVLGIWRMVSSFSNHIFETVEELYRSKNLSTIHDGVNLISILDSISMIGYFCPSLVERQSIIANAMQAAAHASPEGEYTSEFTKLLLDYWLETFHSHREDLNVSNARNKHLVAASRITCILDSIVSSIPYLNVNALTEKQPQLFSLLFSIFSIDMPSLVLSCHAIFRTGMASHKQRAVFLPFVLSYWKQTLLQYPKVLSAVDLISSLDALLQLETPSATLFTLSQHEDSDSSKHSFSTSDILFGCLISLADEIDQRWKETQQSRPLAIAMARGLLKCPISSLDIVFRSWEYLLKRRESSENTSLLSLLRQVVEGVDAVRKPYLIRWYVNLLNRYGKSWMEKGGNL
ncbi:uncharacterized protein Gasu_44760 [Galdieria sulphuraria]|uniref:Uncharacterized protein n=1 Tax=Galdieria sulphuraria TaxID=130081 RepID=M2VXI0_GALSU|nr:uncharacterized protein Gasu_44760 [Galdieria sulphuraria]EME27971.1 hypothetical protein Gasu_44760 [Galdieria sulphuraria]|eukprot:XP_005704491.1 hypothetical protein Gasu_44760 [Galdieria sulphuraria]